VTFPIPGQNSCAKDEIKQLSREPRPAETFERSSAKRHPPLSHLEIERTNGNCVMPHNVRICQRPVQLVKMMVARLCYGAVVGIRSWDGSMALSRTYFDLRFSCTQGKPRQTGMVMGVGISFGTHTIIINSNVTN
jgi:hypothetical protein